MERSKFLPEFKGFISGVVGAWCGVFVGQPFDIIKVRLQNSGGSAILALKNLLSHEGFLTLWKGSLPPLIGVGLSNAVSFGTNENTKRIVSSYNKPGEILSLSQHALCGTSAGFFRAFFSCPAELVRIRMQVQGKIDPRGDPLYKNSIECFISIIKTYGIKGIYRGFSATMIRELMGNTLFFGGYQFCGRKIFGGEKLNADELGKLKIMACGAFAGYCYWAPYCIDVIKSKMQSDSFANPRYKSLLDCLKITYKTDGFSGFFKGWTPTMLRAAPACASLFLGFEATMSIFGRNYR
ncbi:unnamed protein product [Blepharisma stoltei]|uniref:Mitochondrial carrier protein n=1 Tax=Blepharisma stoltei TaxID=1481888 RepID=A0AAU9IAZ9_9CILI|nr:unnamed protein product [Blepharisma stoltei]